MRTPKPLKPKCIWISLWSVVTSNQKTHAKLRDAYDHICRQLATMMASALSWCDNDNKVKEEHAEYFTPPQSPRSDARDAQTLSATVFSPVPIAVLMCQEAQKPVRSAGSDEKTGVVREYDL